MYLLFDTETSNLPQKTLSLDHPNQCRIMQLAAIMLDENLAEVNCFNTLIDIPDDLIVSPGAQAAHGITKEMCKRYGIDIQVALTVLDKWEDLCELVICHNYIFDSERVDNEYSLLSIKRINISPSLCTMKSMTDVCKIPNKFRSGNKWPTLQEAYQFCYGKKFDDAHDALADVRATADIFRYMVKNNIVDVSVKV